MSADPDEPENTDWTKEVRRCVRCSAEFTVAEGMKVSPDRAGCIKCGHRGILMLPTQDVTVKVNVHELRILGIWAENYAATVDNKHLDDVEHESLIQTVGAIAGRIEEQLKAAGKHMPLTLTAEIADLKKARGEEKVTFVRDGREEV